MKMNDMVMVSVDDHISEPPDMFEKVLSGEALATAPKLMTAETGTNYWLYQGMKLPSVGLNAHDVSVADLDQHEPPSPRDSQQQGRPVGDQGIIAAA